MTKNYTKAKGASLSKTLWEYFELHANQRLILFKYYIVFFSLYSYGAAHLVVDHEYENFSVLLKSLSVAFIVVTIIFFFLDARNRMLIHLAQDALEKYESIENIDPELKIFTNEKMMSRFVTARHTILFRCIFALGVAAGIFFILYPFCMCDIVIN